MDARNVATSFVRNNNEYLVVRRSERVRTMRGLWSAISGSINAGEAALERAYAELLEEARIARDSLRLVSSAPPAMVRSERHGGEWRIHAFLFEARDRQVTLNWEGSEHRWVARDSLRLLDSVPCLAGTLDSLL